MASTNKYEDMSAIDALRYVKNRNLLLPEIQREYVWDYWEIEALFESIVDGYPVGYCILWKTSRTTINEEKPNLYYFLRDYKQGESKNEKAPEVYNDETDYYIVLDGQQRITSLNIALYGKFTSYKGGRGHLRTNPNSWITRELYYNLDYYKAKDEDEDDEKPDKRFAFMSDEEISGGNWYKVKELLAYDDDHSYMRALISSDYPQEAQDDLIKLFQRLHDGSSNALIHYYCIVEQDYDKALDIFVRVNSTGRKLSKSDLLFSTLISGWDNGKEKVERLLDSMNYVGDGFQFGRDYLMRLALVLVDANTNLQIKSLTKKTTQEIRDNWDWIESACEKTVRLLIDIGLSNETLTSYNATMPLAYYFYKGGKIKDDESKKEAKKFLSVAMAKRLFGVASNSALNSTRNALKAIDCGRTPFSLDIFKNVILNGREFRVSKEDINFWLDTYEKGQNTYILLSLLYPNCKLNQFTFHQDHCHPYAGFEGREIKKLGLDPEVLADWKRKRNLLPNLQFLEGSENESKNMTPLAEWIDEGHEIKYCPKDVSLKLSDFEKFFEGRRLLIKKELYNIFEIEYTKEDEIEDQKRIGDFE